MGKREESKSTRSPAKNPGSSLEDFLEGRETSDDNIISLLSQRKLPSPVIEDIAGRKNLLENRKVRLALARSPSAPVRVALPQLKYLSSFDLLSLLKDFRIPSVLRKKVENMLLERAPTQPLGIKKTLARLGRGELLVRLLEDTEDTSGEIVKTCLDNPHLTESDVHRAIFKESTSPLAIRMVAIHTKWSLRYSIRLALLRSPHAPLAECAGFLPDIKTADLKNAHADPRIHVGLKIHIRRVLDEREKYLIKLDKSISISEEPDF